MAITDIYSDSFATITQLRVTKYVKVGPQDRQFLEAITGPEPVTPAEGAPSVFSQEGFVVVPSPSVVIGSNPTFYLPEIPNI